MESLFSSAVHVDASPVQVFDYLAAVERHTEWSGSVQFGLDYVEVVTPGPIAVGTRFRSTGRNATGKPNQDLSEIAVLYRPARVGWDTTFRLGPARARFSHRYYLAAEEGGTRLTYLIEKAESLNLVGSLFLFILRTFKRREGEQVALNGLNAFKLAAEREARQVGQPAEQSNPTQ